MKQTRYPRANTVDFLLSEVPGIVKSIKWNSGCQGLKEDENEELIFLLNGDKV